MPEVAKSGFAVLGPNASVSVPVMIGAAISLPTLVEAAKGFGQHRSIPAAALGQSAVCRSYGRTGVNLCPSLSIEEIRVALWVETIVVFADQAGLVSSKTSG